MKKKIVLSLLISALALSTGCSTGIKQDDYDKATSSIAALESEKDALESEKKALESNRSLLQSEKDTLEKSLNGKTDDYEKLNSEYSAYKKKMKSYEEMEEAEATARKVEAEAAANAKKAQDDATQAVKKVWDFEKGALAKGATRKLYDAAANKTNSITDESVKASLNQALSAASDALTKAEKVLAEEEAKKQAAANATTEQTNALSKANDYLDYSAFSYSGLVKQLEYEGFSAESASFAADNCGADWNEQAAKKAKDYLDYSSFSHSGLVDQLEYEGFTKEQAEHGAAAVGY